jgi:tRNA(Ile)-lysidine synthase
MAARLPARLAQNAEKLLAALPAARWHPAALAFAAKRPVRETWGVALSGGADSVALLLLLWAQWPARRGRLVALHFDHRLRGRESRGDAAFCRRLCRTLGVKLVDGAWTAARRDASEAEARAVRLAFLQKNARVLWFGHQQDDIAESLLMRVARGSGTGGLAAPRPVQPFSRGRWHVRPLLTLKKAEIVAALRASGASWREDSTNAGGAFFRNRVRRSVIPAWSAAAARDAVAGAAWTRQLLEEDDAAIEAWLAEIAPFGRGRTLDLTRLAGKPRALWRRALHRWLLAQPEAGELSRQGFDALLAAAVFGKATRQSLGRQGFAVIRAGHLLFQKTGKALRKFQRRAN